MFTPIKGKSRLCRATEIEKNTNEQEIEGCISSVNDTKQPQKAKKQRNSTLTKQIISQLSSLFLLIVAYYHNQRNKSLI
jgi:hypothetical protein